VTKYRAVPYSLLAAIAVTLTVLLGGVCLVWYVSAEQEEPAVGAAFGETALEDDLALQQMDGTFSDPVGEGWVPAFEFCGRIALDYPPAPLHLEYLDRYYASGGGPSYEVWLGQVIPNSCPE